MKTYEIVVTADTNDADYITKRETITEEELKTFRPVFDAIKNCTKYHNWPTSEYDDSSLEKVYGDCGIDISLFEQFNSDYVPRGEYGVHTIDSIELYPSVKLIEKII